MEGVLYFGGGIVIGNVGFGGMETQTKDGKEDLSEV